MDSFAGDLADILVLAGMRGTLYALLAVGFALAYSVGGVINMAHGAYYMMGAYFTYILTHHVFQSSAVLVLILATVMAVLMVGVVGLFVHFVLLRSMKEDRHDYVLAMTLGFALFSGELFARFFGVTRAGVPSIIDGNSKVLGVPVLNQELLVVPVAIAVVLALWAFLRFSRIGRAVTAVAQDRHGAKLMGVNAVTVLALVMFVAAICAGLAGALIAPVRQISPMMWLFPLIKSFAIVVVGGLGSVSGAIIAAYVLGVAEALAALTLGGQYTDLVSVLLIVLVLIIRPTGIMGAREAMI